MAEINKTSNEQDLKSFRWSAVMELVDLISEQGFRGDITA